MHARQIIRTLFCQSGWSFSRRQFATILSKRYLPHRAMSCQTQANLQPKSPDADDKESGKEKKHRSFVEVYDLKSVNLRLTEDSTPYCATVIHPGLSPEAISRNGHPSLPSILKAASACRMYAMHMPANDSGETFFQYDQITSHCFTFISSSLVNISLHMYTSSVPKWPLEVKLQGGHMGRTSLSTVSSMTSPADPERRELMRQINQVVLVDKETRRPIPIEDKWRNLYQSQCVRGEPLIIKRQDVPESGPLSVYQVKIAWSDTDNYNHTNFASYPRFAVDAVHDAVRLGKLEGHLSQAEISSGISQVKTAYLGECVEGDVLKIQVWSVEGYDRTVLCSMEKDGQVINQVTLTFHGPGNSL
ncbi:uncharacterized protein [Littorina saxatilis]|uniref:Uncharacterized protein n=1 Tax=Littorina saxatilis TaxID=31220 RepID=A0AAN9G314_9CAEN